MKYKIILFSLLCSLFISCPCLAEEQLGTIGISLDETNVEKIQEENEIYVFIQNKDNRQVYRFPLSKNNKYTGRYPIPYGTYCVIKNPENNGSFTVYYEDDIVISDDDKEPSIVCSFQSKDSVEDNVVVKEQKKPESITQESAKSEEKTFWQKFFNPQLYITLGIFFIVFLISLYKKWKYR